MWLCVNLSKTIKETCEIASKPFNGIGRQIKDKFNYMEN